MNRGFFTVFGVAVFFAILFGSLTFETVMAKPNSNSSADSGVCHFDNTDTQMWEALWLNSKGQMKAHVNVHGDETFTTEAEAAWCVTNQDGTVVEPPFCEPNICDDANDCTVDFCDEVDDVCFNENLPSGVVCDGGTGVCNDSGVCESAVCGNDVKESGEECDGPDLGGATCEEIPPDGFNLEVYSLGNLQGNVKGYLDAPSNVLMCDDNCMLDFSWCFDT